MLNAIRIILLDDHTWVHQVLTDVVAQADDVLLVGQGINGTEALPLYTQHQPDIVLMDIVMPQMDGIAATRALIAAYPDVKVLALSSFQDERSVFDILRAGATSYLLKTHLNNTLIPTLHTIHNGGTVLSAPIATMLTSLKTQSPIPPPNDFLLTAREIEVIRQLASGQTNTEVAETLHISAATVRFHTTNILEKMGVATRTEAIVLAVRHQII
jgi:NarL family two-component system response regulator LiaR